MFPYSGLPKVPEPFVLHPNVLQHAINHPPVFDKGAEPTFMAPAKVKTKKYQEHFLEVPRKLFSIMAHIWRRR